MQKSERQNKRGRATGEKRCSDFITIVGIFENMSTDNMF